MKSFVNIVLVFLATSVLAQQDQSEEQANEQETTKKKPSWSTGLPERQSPPSMNKPQVDLGKPSMDIKQDAVEMPSADLEIDREGFAMPEINIEPTLPATVPPPAKSSSKSRRSVSFDSGDVEIQKVEKSSPTAVAIAGIGIPENQNGYDWEVYESQPVKIPKSLTFSYKNVELEVHINPQGKVVKVKRISDLTSNLLLNYSTKTLKKWQFRPPSEFGIEEVIKNNIVVNLVER